jgi:crossover junction endodeoxyribonuclease RuvC
MIRTIGIDCGLNGAIAVLVDGQLVSVHDMPTLTVDINKKSKRQVSPNLLAILIESIKPDSAIVERPAARPGQGVTAMFGFGRSLGVVEGVLAGLSVPVTYVAPATWTKAMGKAAGKDASRQRAIELFPAMSEYFKRVKDDGRAEATLIAMWGIKNAR